MIEKIKLFSVATFTNETVIDKLKKINFFYGANGSGKTTITRVLSSLDNYANCQITWKNNSKLKTLVYNEDFIDNYFYNKDFLNGIYTIGEGAKETEEKIKQVKEELNKLNNEKDSSESSIGTKNKDKTNIENIFTNICWEKGYLNFQNDFPDFYTGYRNNKNKFKSKALDEKNNTSTLLSKDELKRKYDSLYAKDSQKINELEKISKEILNEIKNIEGNQKILQTSIIGKRDVDITKMIEKLGNHDWVRQGKEYYDNNYDENKKAYICPFCQQETSEDFRKQLEEYFDETYNQQIKELAIYEERYKKITNTIRNYFSNLLELSNSYLDKKKDTIQDKFNIIDGIINQNLQQLENKKNNPSSKIELKSISNNISEIDTIIDEINKEIQEHNNLVENKSLEKNKLNSELWRFIVNELKTDIENYQKNIDDINKALNSLNNQKKQIELDIENKKNEISDLEKKIKSVKPTVDAINKILDSFGFKGFKLKSTDDEKHYQVIRNDGTDAKKTLSEGERNFLIFLYFYHMVQGVENPDENINEDKILVIDDPVSSFDSDVLFIVSTLIKNILKRVRKDESNVKQVFLFTHNAYFFKEVTFISSRESAYNKREDTMYYIVRKKDNVTCIDKYETCPIKTSYQTLWDDIKKDGIDCISIQNSMRRIIEFYFKFLANINEQELLEKFTNVNEKNICKSLIGWINVGSHDIIDDFNISISNDQIEKYKEIFMRIFEITGHKEHYDMMMNNVNK